MERSTGCYAGSCMPDATCVDGVSEWKNLFGYKDYLGQSYDGKCAFFEGKAALPEAVGWFIVIGLGGLFSLLTSAIFWIAEKKLYKSNSAQLHSSEHFNSAGRTINTGLTACSIVSQWTWAATLLQSSNVAFSFGVSGPFWYASGATIQVLLFAILAVEVKRKCPAVHTICEICLARWGTMAHITFVTFVCTTMLIVTAMLILGGAAVVTALSGMNIYAASFLIPISVVFYTIQGGLHATYFASWSHVGVIYAALLVFMWKVYAGPSDLASADRVYDNLVAAAAKNPVDGNAGGSYLTMWSAGGLVFGVVNIIGNFGTVFCDQSYWQAAIAAKPSATYRGYLLGGLAWFAIPFSMATTLGLAARALDLPLTADEARAGLVPPAVAVHLLGQGGAFLVCLQLFLAVVSTASAEQIGVGSVVAYDVYKRYVNPAATGRQVVLVTRLTVAAWAVGSGVFAAVLREMDMSLGWVYMAMGNVIGSAVCPIAFALTWRDCTAAGAVAGCWGGLGCALAAWCVAAAARGGGVVNVDTLGDDRAMLAGNLVALLSSPVIAVAVSLRAPQRFDWAVLRAATDSYTISDDMGGGAAAGGDDGRKGGGAEPCEADQGDTPEALDRVLRHSWWMGGGLAVVLVVLWPLLTLPEVTFSRGYWAWWVTLAFIWGHAAAAITVLLPLWEGRAGLAVVGAALWADAAPAAGRAFVELEAFVPTGRFGPAAWRGERDAPAPPPPPPREAPPQAAADQPGDSR